MCGVTSCFGDATSAASGDFSHAMCLQCNVVGLLVELLPRCGVLTPPDMNKFCKQPNNSTANLIFHQQVIGPVTSPLAISIKVFLRGIDASAWQLVVRASEFSVCRLSSSTSLPSSLDY